jgi:hypothetical protein
VARQYSLGGGQKPVDRAQLHQFLIDIGARLGTLESVIRLAKLKTPDPGGGAVNLTNKSARYIQGNPPTKTVKQTTPNPNSPNAPSLVVTAAPPPTVPSGTSQSLTEEFANVSFGDTSNLRSPVIAPGANVPGNPTTLDNVPDGLFRVLQSASNTFLSISALEPFRMNVVNLTSGFSPFRQPAPIGIIGKQDLITSITTLLSTDSPFQA